jgi:branched-chain amino acid transport system ATP-binding protein
MPTRLEIHDLQVYLGHSHILQGIELAIGDEPISLIGRNGMGKTTLCKALIGLLPIADGSIRFNNTNLAGLKPHHIARMGIGYVPQGRRIFSSLTVHEHLMLVNGSKNQEWTIERIYDLFPNLASRRNNNGNTLSGGEQQMLAIARALLLNPRLLIMDEPTEGLAPLIVEQLIEIFRNLSKEDMGIFLVEQNFRVATAVSERIAIMVNGRIELETTAEKIKHDEDMQFRFLGCYTS